MFYMQIPFFSLKHIYGSEQCLRWDNLKDSMVAIDGDNLLRVSQKKDLVSFNCTEEEFWGYWYKYFDIGTDYSEYIHRIRGCGKYMEHLVSSSGGARYLNQNLWQVVVESVIASGKTADAARWRIKKFCKELGKEKKKTFDSVQYIWYTTPTPEEIIEGWGDAPPKFKKDVSYQRLYRISIDVKDGYDIWDSVHSSCEGDMFTMKRLSLYGYGNRDEFPPSDRLSDILWDKFGEADIEVVKEWDLDSCRGIRGIALGCVLADENVYGEEQEELRAASWGY